jgi:hypothetical protein
LKASVFYRMASVLLLLFAVGHTFGFLAFRPPTAEGLAVFDAMNRVQFQVGNATFSYGHFYKGFGLSITLFELFEAYLAWYLGSLVQRGSDAIAALSWPFVVLQVTGLVLAWMYFGTVPLVLSVLVAVCLAIATVLVRVESRSGAETSNTSDFGGSVN